MAGRLAQIRAQVDPILSKFARGFMPAANFIGRRIAPIVPVLTKTGTFYTFGKEGFKIYDNRRAARALPNLAEFAIGKDTYATIEHSLATQLDIESEIKEAQRIGQGTLLQLERNSINLAQNSLEIELEKSVADIVMAAASYAANNKVTLSGNDQWKTSGAAGSTSTPIEDIRSGLNAARDTMGRRPNTITFGYDAWEGFIDHPDVIERIKYSQRAIVTEELVAAMFKVQNVFVGEAVMAQDSESDPFVDIWPDSVALTYVPVKNEMAQGTTPHTVVMELMNGTKVKVFDDAVNRNYWAMRNYQVKHVADTYGYLIVDTND